VPLVVFDHIVYRGRRVSCIRRELFDLLPAPEHATPERLIAVDAKFAEHIACRGERISLWRKLIARRLPMETSEKYEQLGAHSVDFSPSIEDDAGVICVNGHPDFLAGRNRLRYRLTALGIPNIRVCGPLADDEGEQARRRQASFSQGSHMRRTHPVEDRTDGRRMPSVEMENALRRYASRLSEKPNGAAGLAVA